MILLNPMTPHLAQYCWKHHIYPILSKCKNYGKECNENLCDQTWPVPSSEIDHVVKDKYNFLKDLKSDVRESWNNSKSGAGSSKKGKGGK